MAMIATWQYIHWRVFKQVYWIESAWYNFHIVCGYY